MNEKQILESIREEVLQGAPSGSATFIASVGINESIFKHAGQLLGNPRKAEQIMGDLTDAIEYLTQYRDRVIERFAPAQKTAAKLVRILETFETHSMNPDPELTALRGRLYRYLGTDVVDSEGEALENGSIAFGYGANGEWAVAAPHEYELVNQIDTSKARVGDHVQVTSLGKVVQITHMTPGVCWHYITDNEDIEYRANVLHKLVSSDTPLG